MDGTPRDLRGLAYRKIAALYTASPAIRNKECDFTRLYGTLSNPTSKPHVQSYDTHSSSDHEHISLSHTPMTLNELRVLLAISKAGPQIDKEEDAKALLAQLSPYILEVHEQVLAPSPFLRFIEPSPWEALTYNLVVAVLVIGINHPSLHKEVHNLTIQYLQRCADTANSLASAHAQKHSPLEDMKPDQIHSIASVTMSLLGFLEASSSYFDFFTVSERLEVISRVRSILTEDFMLSVEGAFSAIRTADPSNQRAKDWKIYSKRYASTGRPLGAMLLQRSFMKTVVSCSSLQITTAKNLRRLSILDFLMTDGLPQKPIASSESTALTEALSDIATDEMRLLEDGADYLQLGSSWQQHLASTVKGYALIVFLGCVMVNEEIADIDTLMVWLEDTMADPVQIADEVLACTVLKSMVVTAKFSPAVASALSRSFPKLIVQGSLRGQTVIVAARCLAQIFQLLSHDTVITGLYSLGNILSAPSGTEKILGSTAAAHGNGSVPRDSVRYTQLSSESAISLNISGEEETSAAYGNIIRAIVTIATTCKDSKTTPLAQSMLLQKFGRLSMAVDLHIIVETAILAANGGELELKSLLKLYDRFDHEAVLQSNSILLEAIMRARVQVAETLAPESPNCQIYLLHLLEAIVSKGDVNESENTHQADVEVAAKEIGQLLRPLAILISAIGQSKAQGIEENAARLQRDAWFNIAVHGITPGSRIGQKYLEELRILAKFSRTLVMENHSEQFENDIDLNTVLRRGMSAAHASEMKRRLTDLLETQEPTIKALSYPRVIFLHAAYLLETLRAEAGDCASVLSYFMDQSVNQDGTSTCMVAIADVVMTIYLRRTTGGIHPDRSAHYVAKQLAMILTSCCHRIPQCQRVAARCAEKLIWQIPSSLCQKSSLFTVLELLTLLWSSCLEAEIDEYEWKSSYTSTLGKVTLELSDNFAFRESTLSDFYLRAQKWVMRVINIAPLDVKGLLQTYLSEYDDDGAYGHVALGRSFALEMGSKIPDTDQRLSAIDHKGACNINTGSDFIAQYTTRQEYKFADALPEHDQEWVKLLRVENAKNQVSHCINHNMEDAQAILAVLEHRALSQKFISIGELRDILRRAAALLCRSKADQSAIVHHLVGIPFRFFTKQSIKLGISLWLGVINENPHMEPRILVELAENWERTVQQKNGIFNENFNHPDPFYEREEFTPSDKSVLLQRQQAAHNLIAPHLRILQFLASHFSANRLGSPHLRRIFQRLIRITLKGIEHSKGHPLTREFHLHVVLLALVILRHSDDLGEAARWRLKDRALAAALSWFSHPQRWSFGGNRLQIKAETRLIGDIEAALGAIYTMCSSSTASLPSLTLKQELLQHLLKSESTRLQVWLFPSNHEQPHLLSLHRSEKYTLGPMSIQMLGVAWEESPSLAVQLWTRFASASMAKEMRSLLLTHPEKAIGDPDALQILLENGFSRDLSFQLKYMLYWAPANPITAATYFLPVYNNHPYILQYAMRALESHSVDVTFFYVPQIVQALRYDALGYVQQYIIETAKFSQLFAHQIIWNMKANAYKDEDSTVEDSLKPKLDKVRDDMIAHFSETDKAFYEKEFNFFNEITDISGKLRPFIKKSKPEKKQKIEEELRKIRVEVGVYLPSNPDGIVIGIDRKSGKPLQSHAKAPYMATFRIKKNGGKMEGTDDMLEKTNQNEHTSRSGPITQESTYEVWQSAIFKVGDDCRQDVLALQLIAAFRGIFNNVGLDVYVYPYRVTATAPGCGVIDVLPNSISRDMLGREAVNGLYDYFVSKYGGEQFIRFQEARNNFVKSMAAYSVISYLLQFKDRHNGNIMIDDAGHILHIDFGFCFDIAPGGVKFERAPFKLTSEMIAVMGGSTTSQSFRWFEELCIKSFLASRQYAEKLCHMVVLMLDSGLPCFKPETIHHFRDRFVLEKSEREAADFMKDLIKESYGSYSTGLYDLFQLRTNGIPY